MENTFDLEDLVIVPATQVQTGTVIFLHGLGQSILAWKLVVDELLSHRIPNIMWILPQAPKRPVTVRNGLEYSSWFNISHWPPYMHEFDDATVSESIQVVEKIILAQVYSGTDARRIIIAGFGQGAALGMMVSLTSLHELGGSASLSGWIPKGARDQMIYVDLPIFWAYGDGDEQIPPTFTEESIAFLRHRLNVPGSKLELKECQGLGHRVNDDVLEDLLSWLLRVLE